MPRKLRCLWLKAPNIIADAIAWFFGLIHVSAGVVRLVTPPLRAYLENRSWARSVSLSDALPIAKAEAVGRGSMSYLSNPISTFLVGSE